MFSNKLTSQTGSVCFPVFVDDLYNGRSLFLAKSYTATVPSYIPTAINDGVYIIIFINIYKNI